MIERKRAKEGVGETGRETHKEREREGERQKKRPGEKVRETWEERGRENLNGSLKCFITTIMIFIHFVYAALFQTLKDTLQRYKVQQLKPNNKKFCYK